MSNSRPRIINPKDIIEYVLPKYKFVLIVAIVAAVLMAAYTYYQDIKAVKAEQAAESYDYDSFTEEEKTEIQNAIDAKTVKDEAQEYYDNSYIFKVDPFAVSTTTLIYKVELDMSKFPADKSGQEGTYITKIRDEIYFYISRGMLAEDVGKALGLKTEYIAELISVESFASDSLIITVRADDILEKIIDTVNVELGNRSEEYSKTYVIHDIKMNSCVSTVMRNDDFYNRQKNSILDINYNYSSLKNMVSKLDSHQLAYYNDTTGSTELYIDPDTNKEVEPYLRTSVAGYFKNAIVGMFAGAVVGVLILLGKLMYSKYIMNLSDYTASLKLTLIEDIDDEASIDRADLKLTTICNRDNIDKLVLLTSVNELINDSKIDSVIDKTDVVIEKCIYNSNDKSSLENILNVNNVCLLERIGKTKYSELEATINLCEKLGIHILGIINVR